MARYENVVFFQDERAEQWLETLQDLGPDETIRLMASWHYPGEHETRKDTGCGRWDETHSYNGYVLSWHLGHKYGHKYISLLYDTYHDVLEMYSKEIQQDVNEIVHLVDDVLDVEELCEAASRYPNVAIAAAVLLHEAGEAPSEYFDTASWDAADWKEFL